MTIIEIILVVTPIIIDFIISFKVFSTNTFLLLEYILYIYYLIYFKKYQIDIWTLINSRHEVNIITLIYIVILDFNI